MNFEKTIVVSLGGSIINPGEIDIEFLKKFKIFIKNYSSIRFIIVCGGGIVARHYQKALRTINNDIADEQADWLGISATKINAQLIKEIFFDEAYHKIISDPTKIVDTDKRLIFACGWKPGFSTDYDAVLLGKQFDAHLLINMSNIDYVYDKDPKKFADAKKIENISWEDFRKIVGNEWSPGLNAPFDPIAAKEAQECKMKVVIINGKNLDNLQRTISGNSFSGTLIS